MNKIEHMLVTHYRLKPQSVGPIIGHVRWQVCNDEAVHLFDDESKNREIYAVNVDGNVGVACWDPESKMIVAFLTQSTLFCDPRVEFDDELRAEIQDLLKLPCPRGGDALERVSHEYAGKFVKESGMKPGVAKALLIEFDRELSTARAIESIEQR